MPINCQSAFNQGRRTRKKKEIKSMSQKLKCIIRHSSQISNILKPILFYLLIILFDGSGDINFSYCFVFTFVFRLFFLLLRLLRCFTDALHDGCKHLRSSHCLQRARHFSYNFYFSFVVFPPLQLNQACRICLSVTLPLLASKRLTISS